MVNNLQIPNGYDIYYTFTSNLEDVMNKIGKFGKNQTYFDIPFLEKQDKVIDYFENKKITFWKDKKGEYQNFLIKIYHAGFNLFGEILYNKNQVIKAIIVSDQEIGVLSNNVEFVKDRLYSYYKVTFEYTQLCYPYSQIKMSNDCRNPNSFDLTPEMGNISSPVGGKNKYNTFSYPEIVNILNDFISVKANVYELGVPSKWTLSIVQDLKLIPSLENVLLKMERNEICFTQDILTIKFPYYLPNNIHALFDKIKLYYYSSDLELKTNYLYSMYVQLLLLIVSYYNERNLDILKWKENNFKHNLKWNIDVQIQETIKNINIIEKNIEKIFSPNEILYNQVRKSIMNVKNSISELNRNSNFSIVSKNIITSIEKFDYILKIVINPPQDF